MCVLSYEYDSRFFIQEINSLKRQVRQFVYANNYSTIL